MCRTTISPSRTTGRSRIAVTPRIATSGTLITGVAMNFFFSSIILFIQYISDFTESFRIIRWLMGGFETVGYSPIYTLLPFLCIGGFAVLFMIKELNLFLLGDDIAISRGVNVNLVKKILFFATSMLIGAVVSICGPIGFIGMMAPHICRLIIGTDHRYLTPATFLFGGAFLWLFAAALSGWILLRVMPHKRYWPEKRGSGTGEQESE